MLVARAVGKHHHFVACLLAYWSSCRRGTKRNPTGPKQAAYIATHSKIVSNTLYYVLRDESIEENLSLKAARERKQGKQGGNMHAF